MAEKEAMGPMRDAPPSPSVSLPTHAEMERAFTPTHAQRATQDNVMNGKEKQNEDESERAKTKQNAQEKVRKEEHISKSPTGFYFHTKQVWIPSP